MTTTKVPMNEVRHGLLLGFEAVTESRLVLLSHHHLNKVHLFALRQLLLDRVNHRIPCLELHDRVFKADEFSVRVLVNLVTQVLKPQLLNRVLLQQWILERSIVFLAPPKLDRPNMLCCEYPEEMVLILVPLCERSSRKR